MNNFIKTNKSYIYDVAVAVIFTAVIYVLYLYSGISQMLGDIGYKFMESDAADILIFVALIFLSLSIATYKHLSSLNSHINDIYEISLSDELTGLYNRRAIDRFINQHTSSVVRYENYSFSVVMLEIDNFKYITDNFGFHIGDKALKIFANFLKRYSRSSDLCGRFYGEVFVVLLPHTDVSNANKFAEKLLIEIENVKLDCNEKKIELIINYGVSGVNENNTASSENVLFNAEEQLYKSKKKAGSLVNFRSIV